MVNTLKFPTHKLILEGPDLSGKTTLFYDIHKMTDYRWNIQDRSALSMFVFARFYQREMFSLIENLRSELYNLNNRIVILLPPWNLISKRYTQRGDDIHNLISLKQTYDIFSEAVLEFEHYPNVIIVRTENCKEQVIQNIISLEHSTFKDIQSQVLQLVTTTKNFEAIGVHFIVYDDGRFKNIDEDALEHEDEKEYYERIRIKLLEKLANELKGDNEYNRIECKASRRFIYTDNSCISLAHFNYRENCLDCHFVLRSSNVHDTLYYDLNFLYSLCKQVYNYLSLDSKVFCRMRFTINSAHVPNIIN